MFKEDLPEMCPPSDSSDEELLSVWRFVDPAITSVDEVSMQCFLSHAELGIGTGNADDCSARSCSLWNNASIKTASKYPKLKRKNMVRLDIPLGSGKSLSNGKGHVHFWMYRACDPCLLLQELVVKNA